MDSNAPGPVGVLLGPEPARLGRRRPKWLLPVVAVLLPVVVLGFLWLGNARVLQGAGTESRGRIQPGHTLYVDTGIYPSSGDTVTIDISEIHVRTTLNTADAAIELLTCTIPPDSTRIGVVSEDGFAAYCPGATAWRSGTITMGADAGTAYIVLAITPQREGRVTIDGADVSFRAGIRHGTQHVGTTIVVTTD